MRAMMHNFISSVLGRIPLVAGLLAVGSLPAVVWTLAGKHWVAAMHLFVAAIWFAAYALMAAPGATLFSGWSVTDRQMALRHQAVVIARVTCMASLLFSVTGRIVAGSDKVQVYACLLSMIGASLFLYFLLFDAEERLGVYRQALNREKSRKSFIARLVWREAPAPLARATADIDEFSIHVSNTWAGSWQWRLEVNGRLWKDLGLAGEKGLVAFGFCPEEWAAREAAANKAWHVHQLDEAGALLEIRLMAESAPARWSAAIRPKDVL